MERSDHTGTTESSGKRKLLSRRRFLSAAGLTTIGGAGTYLYTWRLEPHWVDWVERELPIANLPSALEGASLVQISDIHVGRIVDDDFLIDSLRAVERLEPDIIAITGDIVTWHPDRVHDQAARLLEHLPHGSLATLGVLGNHDYGRRFDRADEADRLVRSLNNIGIDIICNDVREVNGLRIAGLEDYWGPRFSPEPTLARLAADDPSIVLCHNPDVADLDVWGEFRGWMLAGHTHGGQCDPPFFNPPLLPVENRRYVEGAYDLPDGRRMYINRGLGYLKRVRFNSRPEITRFRLRRA